MRENSLSQNNKAALPEEGGAAFADTSSSFYTALVM